MSLKRAFAARLRGSGVDGGAADRLLEEFEGKSVSCALCCGFYGPSGGRPLCVTCHEFEYPSFDELVSKKKFDVDDPDSDADSGNEDEEPDPFRPNEETLADELNNDRMADQVRALSSYSTAQRHLPEDWLERNFTADLLLPVIALLDPLSKWSCSRVCSRWRQLVRESTTSEYWETAVRQLWPLYDSSLRSAPTCWFKTFTRLVLSTSCRICLQRQQSEASHFENDHSYLGNPADRRLEIEERSTSDRSWDGVFAKPFNANRSRWIGNILGPVGSPYEGGQFFVSIKVPQEYPMHPLKVRFITKIFHPNISAHGDVGIDLLCDQWCSAFGVMSVLAAIQSLLTDPNADVCMSPAIGRLFRANRAAYDAIAQMWTYKFAMVEGI